ncbi:MAG: prepilin-type N-terminal cleavage/methylation domain-containing protein [bacterium]|nr:prepilin-type N-terminal cleavage/methylation domain-containing protein [bacterium]
MKKKHRACLPARQGFSLIEVVVYLALIAVVGVVIVESVFTVYKSYARLRVERRVMLNGDAAMETIIRSVREATSTDSAGSVFGTNPGILSAGGKIFSVNSSNGALQIDDGSGNADITTDASITNLVFYRQATTTSEIIKIEMTLSAGQGSFNKTRNFFGSAVLRGKY